MHRCCAMSRRCSPAIRARLTFTISHHHQCLQSKSEFEGVLLLLAQKCRYLFFLSLSLCMYVSTICFSRLQYVYVCMCACKHSLFLSVAICCYLCKCAYVHVFLCLSVALFVSRWSPSLSPFVSCLYVSFLSLFVCSICVSFLSVSLCCFLFLTTMPTHTHSRT